jgi:hypothetical protein
MNNQLSIKLAFVCLSLIFFASCKREHEHISPSKEGNTQTGPAEKIVLGRKLENPYSVENMKLAFSNIASSSNSRISSDNSPVRLTHLYLRFLPKDWAEYDLLKSDTTLKLYQIPLDYEIQTYGNTYQDPDIPEGNPTWQYVAIKYDYNFNKNIRHEILAELYLPESDSSIDPEVANLRIHGKGFVDALVDEAMILTKNYDDTLQTNSNNRAAWNPNGIVKVYDTRLGKLIPLQGVRMRARRWFDVNEAVTDHNGWYQTGGFKRPANYSLVFETGGFDIRSGTFGQAMIDGPKQKSSWNVDLWDGVNRFYAHVFRGAWRYHYGYIGGLSRPFLGFKLKYAAYDKSGSVQGLNIGNWTLFSINPNIFVYRFDGIVEFDSDEIFSTTCHETCHTTHWKIMNAGPIQFGQVNEFIRESWPIAVELYLTSMEYRSLGILNYGTPDYDISVSYPLRRAYQYWPEKCDKKYSSIFINLIDDFNESINSRNPLLPNDQVTGYNLREIESTFLKHVYGQSSLRDQLKKYKPQGTTDYQIDLLMNSY